jgi:hypothetical protein
MRRMLDRPRSRSRSRPTPPFPSSFLSAAALPREAERYVRTGRNSDRRIHAAHRSQRAYRQPLSTPTWRDEVFSELPDDLRFIARKNVQAHDAPVGLRADPDTYLSDRSWQGCYAAEADDHLLPVG